MSELACVWHLYYVLECRLLNPSKPKYLIMVCRDEGPRVFIVNTSIPRWTKDDVDRLASQVLIRASGHPLLQYDCYVDCANLWIYADDALQGCRHHAVSEGAKFDIQAAVDSSRTVSPALKRLILAS